MDSETDQRPSKDLIEFNWLRLDTPSNVLWSNDGQDSSVIQMKLSYAF